MTGADTGRIQRPKLLRNMPHDVRASTLLVRAGPIGACFRFAQALAQWLLQRALTVAAFMVAASVLLLIPAASVREIVPVIRGLVTGWLAFLLVACVGYRWVFELEGRVPRKDRQYPLISVISTVPEFLCDGGESFPLSWIAFGYSGLLWPQWWWDWQAVPNEWHTLGHAVASSAVGLGSLWYGRTLPFHGYQRPTEEDMAAAAMGGMQGGGYSSAGIDAEYGTPVQAADARRTFADIHGMEPVKRRMREAGAAILGPRPDSEAPRNGVLLHGEPGNGKTVFAEALAGELGVPIVVLTYGMVSSKWLGEMPRLITNCFRYAKLVAPCVFFIDEVDSFIRSRDGMPSSEDLKIANTMLTEIVGLRDAPVLLMAATNYLSSLDPAAIREGRFDFKIEVTAPDEAARVGLLDEGLKKYAAALEVDRQALQSVARRWAGFSASRLLAVVKALPAYAAERQVQRVGFDDWMAALRLVQGRKGQVPASARKLADLVLQHPTREALELIARRLRNAEHAEASGGTLPGGILFHGPSGTGKTVAAQALALESGWAFLAIAGPDLLADRQKLQSLYREACDLRPALIFIDEADDVLRERQFNPQPDLVNRLLVLMDGSAGRVSDVVFIAATNHPELIDTALLRAGRFTEKVAFGLPSAEQVEAAVGNWLRTRQVRLEEGLDAPAIASMLQGLTMADVDGVLQYGLNRAIGRGNAAAALMDADDIAMGLQVVMGRGS